MKSNDRYRERSSSISYVSESPVDMKVMSHGYVCAQCSLQFGLRRRNVQPNHLPTHLPARPTNQLERNHANRIHPRDTDTGV